MNKELYAVQRRYLPLKIPWVIVIGKRMQYVKIHTKKNPAFLES